MGVGPSEFKDHSDRIKDGYDDEIARRCVISRRYYYLFHHMKQSLSDKSQAYFEDNGSDHGEVADYFERIGRKDLADDYHDLRRKRNKVDYDIDEEIDETELEMFENELEFFLSNTKRLI